MSVFHVQPSFPACCLFCNCQSRAWRSPSEPRRQIVQNGDFSANAANFQGNGYLAQAQIENEPAQHPELDPQQRYLPNMYMGINGINNGISTFAPATNVPSFLFMQGDETASQVITGLSQGDVYFLGFAAARCANFGPAGLVASLGSATAPTPVLTIPAGTLSEVSFLNYGTIFGATNTSGTIQFHSTGFGDYTADLTSVVVTDLGPPTNLWSGTTSGNFGGPDLNWGGGQKTFADTNGSAGGTVYFGDNDGVGGAVVHNALNVVPGAVSSGTLQFVNNTVNYSLSNSDTGGVTGSTAIWKNGIGTLTITGTNTYTGGTTVSSGVLVADRPAALPGYDGSPGPITVAGGAVLGVQLGDGTTGWSSDQIATLVANAQLGDSTAGLGIDTSNGDATYDGSISQGLTLVKLGAHTLTLTGTNTNSGGTQIRAGILCINADTALSNSPLVFAGSGTLQAGADGIAFNASRNITLNPGLTATIDTQGFQMSIAAPIHRPGRALQGRLRHANTEQQQHLRWRHDRHRRSTLGYGQQLPAGRRRHHDRLRRNAVDRCWRRQQHPNHHRRPNAGRRHAGRRSWLTGD